VTPLAARAQAHADTLGIPTAVGPGGLCYQPVVMYGRESAGWIASMGGDVYRPCTPGPRRARFAQNRRTITMPGHVPCMACGRQGCPGTCCI